VATSFTDTSQRRAAKIAGIACPLSFAVVVSVNFGIFQRLVGGDDPAQNARNILASERLFRVGLAGNLLYGVGVLVLSAALYVVLKPVGQNLALLATLGRLVHGFTWLLFTLNLFTALRLLTRPDYARAFSPEQLPSLARLYLSGFDHYYVGLLFWSMGATAGAYLWLESGYIPRWLAAFGVLASAWCAVCTFALFLFPGFPKLVNLWWFDTPMALFELALSFLLLFRGLRPSELGTDQT
jgi:uncharacterized protein DUF4386